MRKKMLSSLSNLTSWNWDQTPVPGGNKPPPKPITLEE